MAPGFLKRGKRKKGKTILGLDIGSRYLKLVEVKKESKGFRLLSYGIEELPPEAIVGKEIMDRQVVIDKLTQLREKCSPQDNRAVINIAGRGVIVKKITMPYVSDKELEEAVQWQVRENIPFDLSDVSWDYRVLRKDEISQEIEILLVAAKNDVVYNLLDIVKSSGYKPVVIDLDPMALLNLLANIDYLSQNERCAVINIGYETTGVLLIRNGTYNTNREIPIATKVYIEALMRFLDLPADKATSALVGKETEGHDIEDIRRIAESINEKLAEHLERLFPDFRPIGEEESLDKIYLSGGGANIIGLREFLANRYNIPVEIMDPLPHFKMDADLINDEEKPLIAPLLSTALGLAIRKIGKPAIPINLLPLEEREIEKPPFLTVPEAIVTMAPPILVLLFILGTSMKTSSHLKKTQKTLLKVKAEQEEFKKKVRELRIIEAKRNEIKKRIDLLSKLAEGRYTPIKILDELNRILPDGIWLTQLTEEDELPSGAVRLRIKGGALSLFDITDFLDVLNASPLFNSVELIETSKEEKEGQVYIKFEILVASRSTLD